MNLEEKRNKALEVLANTSGEIVALLFTDFHGMQLISEGFIDFLVDEGIMNPFYEEADDE